MWVWVVKAAALGLHRCMRVLPHANDTGGFFVALLRKTNAQPPPQPPPPDLAEVQALAPVLAVWARVLSRFLYSATAKWDSSWLQYERPVVCQTHGHRQQKQTTAEQKSTPDKNCKEHDKNCEEQGPRSACDLFFF